MNNKYKYQGMWPVAPTPFHENGEVDYEALSQRAYEQWEKVSAEKMSNLQLGIYKELIDR